MPTNTESGTALEVINSEIDQIATENQSAEQIEDELSDANILATKQAKDLMTGFCLSITYSAGIGGTGSLVGTTPNLLLKGHYDEY